MTFSRWIFPTQPRDSLCKREFSLYNKRFIIIKAGDLLVVCGVVAYSRGDHEVPEGLPALIQNDDSLERRSPCQSFMKKEGRRGSISNTSLGCKREKWDTSAEN